MKEEKCKHIGYWVNIDFLLFKKKMFACLNCKKVVSQKEVFKNADILHMRNDGLLYTGNNNLTPPQEEK